MINENDHLKNSIIRIILSKISSKSDCFTVIYEISHRSLFLLALRKNSAHSIKVFETHISAAAHADHSFAGYLKARSCTVRTP